LKENIFTRRLILTLIRSLIRPSIRIPRNKNVVPIVAQYCSCKQFSCQ
jgi:hypothetical protein